MEKKLRQIHEDACFLLENFGLGVVCKTDKETDEVIRNDELILKPFLDKAVERFGMNHDGLSLAPCNYGRLYFKRALIDWALATAPKRAAHPLPNKTFGNGGTAPWVCIDGELVDADVNVHVAPIAKIGEKCGVPFLFRGVGMPHNVHEDTRQLEVMRAHYGGYLYLYNATSEGVAACKKEYKKNPMLATTHSILTAPLVINNVGPNWPIFYESIESGLPVYLLTMPHGWQNAPSSLYGLVIQAHAEFLAGLCITQVMRPGLLTVHAGFPQAGNPSNDYLQAFGSIEHQTANIWLAWVASYLDLPAIQDGCSTSNPSPVLAPETQPDTIRAYKIWNAASKIYPWHQVRHCFGFGYYQDAVSYARMENDCIALQHVLDNDLTESVPDLEYDEEAVSVIIEVVTERRGNFVDYDEHNLKHTRKVM